MNYNEQEVGKLIQRATELHEQSVGDSEQNLSLSEIENIAAELGVPSRFLQEAAMEMKDGSLSKKSFSLFGAPFSVQQARVADGTLSEREWEEIVIELQRYSGKTGSAGEVGQTRHWEHAVGEGETGFNFEKLKITTSPAEDGQTSIRIRQDYHGAVVMYIMAFGFTSFVTLMVAHSLPDVSKILELVYAGMGGVISLGGVRALVAASANRYKEKLANLADRLHQIVERSKDELTDGVERSESLDIPDLDSYGPMEEDPESGSRHSIR